MPLFIEKFKKGKLQKYGFTAIYIFNSVKYSEHLQQ